MEQAQFGIVREIMHVLHSVELILSKTYVFKYRGYVSDIYGFIDFYLFLRTFGINTVSIIMLLVMSSF